MSDGQGFDSISGVEIDGIQTNIVLNRFTNKYFVIITQRNKMCNLFTIKFDSYNTIPGVMSTTAPITIINNFGEDSDEIRSAITFLVSNSKLQRCPIDIVMSLGLQNINGKILKNLVTVLDELLS